MFKEFKVKKFESKDHSRDNLNKLIELYAQYRQAQYTLFEQYNLCLEDPKFDTIYLNIEPLEKYREYIEHDLNGAEGHSSTTQIIKEFKKLLETYDNTLHNYEDKKKPQPLDILN